MSVWYSYSVSRKRRTKGATMTTANDVTRANRIETVVYGYVLPGVLGLMLVGGIGLIITVIINNLP